LAKFKGKDIVVFDNGDFYVVQTDPETMKLENKEVTVLIRDFRTKPIINLVIYLLGVFCGGLLGTLIHFLL